MLDPVILLCLLLCLCGLAIAFRAFQVLIGSRGPSIVSLQANPPETPIPNSSDDPLTPPFRNSASDAASSANGPSRVEGSGKGEQENSIVTPGHALETEVSRIVETLRTIELSHVDGLRLLDRRFDALEVVMAGMRADLTQRIAALESRAACVGPPASAPLEPPPAFQLPEKPSSHPFA